MYGLLLRWLGYLHVFPEALIFSKNYASGVLVVAVLAAVLIFYKVMAL
jgi:hypothetical protein